MVATPGAPVATQGSSVVVSTPVQAQAGAITINGAGATFPFPLYSKWFYDYAFVDTSAKFNYQSIGSGGGIKQITEKTVDFGASDAILNDDQFKAAPGIQMFPTVAGAEAIAVNLKDADGNAITAPIKFPYTSVADIYLRQDQKVERSGLNGSESGYQAARSRHHRGAPLGRLGNDVSSSPTTFPKSARSGRSKVGNAASVQWPVGLGGKGNEGVYGTVSQNEGAIGYVELAYALQNKAVINVVENKANQYVAPSSDSTQAAMKDFGTELGDKLALSITDGPGEQSYPIAGYTYLLLYMDQQDCTKAQKLVAFMNWAYGSDGTKDATDLSYVPLPDAVKQQVQAKISKITCQGKPLG